MLKDGDGANTVAYSHDGLEIAGGGTRNDYMVHVWNTSTGSAIRTFTEPAKGMDAVAYSPRGDLLVTWGTITGMCGGEQTVR
jgi:WD40 repeat protein